jgi:hypothetical protein
MRLYRPVGMIELQRIYESGMTAFPPRLPEQPIFYPVLNFPYAAQIARDWNTKSNSFAGYVTRFDVDDHYVSRFERQVVGNRQHEELWVPAEELEEFNSHIHDRITVVAAYFGPRFVGYVPESGLLKEFNAVQQFATLRALGSKSRSDFEQEFRANSLSVFLHYPFWQQRDWSVEGISVEERDTFLADIKRLWQQFYPAIALPDVNETASSD